MLGLLLVPMPIHAQLPASDDAHATQIEAEFRGCESAGWCRFWIESPDRSAQSQYRVRPDGIPRRRGGDAISIAVRNRLNALLSNMIHQAKHIVLHDLHKLDDGTFAATVTVNGVNLAADPILLELREKADGTIR
ncbi:MAG TPA: hypothetical protein VKD04_01680 [Burkholderiales bacterium]|nr:hypothetical protein [Burkholderiales bacterium]